jgi:hypothetical protein
MALDRPCANPTCSCSTGDVTCSLWCGALDRPAGARCACRHDGCGRSLARAPLWPARADARTADAPLVARGRPPLHGVGAA